MQTHLQPASLRLRQQLQGRPGLAARPRHARHVVPLAVHDNKQPSLREAADAEGRAPGRVTVGYEKSLGCMQHTAGPYRLASALHHMRMRRCLHAQTRARPCCSAQRTWRSPPPCCWRQPRTQTTQAAPSCACPHQRSPTCLQRSRRSWRHGALWVRGRGAPPRRQRRGHSLRVRSLLLLALTASGQHVSPNTLPPARSVARCRRWRPPCNPHPPMRLHLHGTRVAQARALWTTASTATGGRTSSRRT